MYESYYGLSGKPFQLSPDPRFLFLSAGHKRALAYLRYGLVKREGFIVITGDVGAGKTTLIRSLVASIETEGITAAHVVSTMLDADQMLQGVATAFKLGQPGMSKAQLLAEIQRHFVYLHRARRRALLVVDEAQNLPPSALEELRMLSNFQEADQPLLQTFLVGQPEFREIVQRPEMLQLRQRIIAAYHLAPLARHEVRGYVEHRLKTVGWTGHPLFTDGTFDAAYDATGGVPRQLNTLFDRLLLAGFLDEKQVFDAPDVEEIVRELAIEFAPSVREPIGYNEPSWINHAPIPQPALPVTATQPIAAREPTPSTRESALQDRVDQLESSLTEMTQALKALLAEKNSDRQTEQDAKPAAKSRAETRQKNKPDAKTVSSANNPVAPGSAETEPANS